MRSHTQIVIFIFRYIYLLCMCVGAHIHAMYTRGSQGTIWGSGLSFLLCGSQELNSGGWAWQQVLFSDENAPPP